MASRLDEIKARARAVAATAGKKLASGARATGLRARSAGRAISTGASKQREAFCARTAPPPPETVVRARVERAMRIVAPKLGYTAEDFTVRTADDAAGVAGLVMAKALRGNRLARATHRAALHWSWWLQDKKTDDLRDAYRYAQDAIEEAS